MMLGSLRDLPLCTTQSSDPSDVAMEMRTHHKTRRSQSASGIWAASGGCDSVWQQQNSSAGGGEPACACAWARLVTGSRWGTSGETIGLSIQIIIVIIMLHLIAAADLMCGRISSVGVFLRRDTRYLRKNECVNWHSSCFYMRWSCSPIKRVI